ncbi:MAG TPA: 16S rRNA (cytidine(1402)-2'-O)-methyltransferase [Bacilli bacterium]|nr:16S rRNA (cytidine(1402)-2'-O)-methyltransferase [Bacilli bacterium]
MKRNKSFASETPFYFVATPIGNLDEFSLRAQLVLLEADFICVEDTRISMKLLNAFNIRKKLITVHKFSEQAKVDEIIDKLKSGLKGAFLSDAGYPLISDPGARLLDSLLAHDIPVSVINGPSAFLPALVLSNLPVLPFTFLGFLPSKEGELKRTLEKIKYRPETLVIYEAPHRVSRTIKTLFEVFGERSLVIARELTKINEEYIYTTLSEFSKESIALRGEIVLVVQGLIPAKEHDLQKYNDHVKLLIEENYKSSEAIKIVSLLFNINKNELYEYHLKHKDD